MKWLVALVLAGCADNTIAIAPVIDVPANDNASAFPLDELVLAVAHAGDSADLVSQTFSTGQHVSLPGVPFGDDLVIHMTGSVGSSEVAYGRSCKIAVNASEAPSPHLFFSRSVKFADLDLPTPPEARMAGQTITDVDGAGIVLGGIDPASLLPLADVERFDPQTGTLTALATLTPRTGAVAASLGVGGDTRIALIGGSDPATGAGATFVELIEPDAPISRRVERIDDAQMARTGLTATALTDGRVIAIGGNDSGTPSAAVDEVSIESGTAAIRVLRALLGTPRYAHTATRLGDDVGAAVLVAGGLDATGAVVKTAELFKPLSESFSLTTYAMNTPRLGHRAVLMPDGSVLIIGGIYIDPATGTRTPVATLELFTLDAGFTELKDANNVPITLPANAGLIDFAATPLPDGRVLLTGGRRTEGGDPLDTAFIARLDPIDGSVDVVATDHMSSPRAGHSATLLCDGTVLITGGTTDIAPAARYNPPALGRR
ncbi:MAG: hypothetical protein ABI591_22665 [Kofleriaceae bacterium]